MIRLYGPVVGNSSFARVAEGMRHGLEALGHLAGFVPVDSAYDEEAVYPGHKASIGVFVGPLDRAAMMTGIGWHEHRLVLLPANSTWVPEGLVRALEKVVTGFLAPSAWAANVLRGYTKLPVTVWRHGVLPTFQPDARDQLALIKDYANGEFRVGHLASTCSQRKGTRELVRAWCRAVLDGSWLEDGGLGPRPLLTLVVDGPHDVFQKDVEEASGGDRKVLESIVWSRRRWNMDAIQAAHWYRKQHLIAQPSRGEGFGMVPLEALACGVPVLTTACTGHSEYVEPLLVLRPGLHAQGIALVEDGELAAIDDGPGALAPSLTEGSVHYTLVQAFRGWGRKDVGLLAGAQRTSKYVHEHWNWTEVTRLFLKEFTK